MRQKKGQTSRNSTLALIAGVVGLSLLFVIHTRKDNETPSIDANVPSEDEPTISVPQQSNAEPSLAFDTPAKLPYIDFPPGSVEEACGFNDFVSFHADRSDDKTHWPRSIFDANGDLAAFFSESNECRTALNKHVNAINPYLWGESHRDGSFAFFELEDPLTFERIFADPLGDFSRVQEALSRPECVTRQEDGLNWELQESCHADALMNYALINRYCYHDGVDTRSRTYYREGDNLTPTQDRFMWKQELEDAWVTQWCDKIPTDLHLYRKLDPQHIELLKSMEDPKFLKGTISMLIELAARLGEEAAGITLGHKTNKGTIYLEHGVMFGRNKRLLSSFAWKELQLKKEPSRERFLQTFHFLADLTQEQTKFDWNWVVHQLCTPPYFESDDTLQKVNDGNEQGESDETKSCRTVVYELYTEELVSGPVLDMVNQFERTALNLDLYD